MDKIPSFEKDHDKLQPGFHFCTLQNGVATFDLRMKKPNAGDFLAQPALHSIEHMLATALRNGRAAKNIVYFGPMGCRTGFYLLTAGISFDEAYVALREGMDAAMRMDEVPGSAKQECGNYLEHDLALAKAELSAYAALLEDEAALDADREAYAEAARR